MKRILSAILCAAMFLSLFVTGFANEQGSVTVIASENFSNGISMDGEYADFTFTKEASGTKRAEYAEYVSTNPIMGKQLAFVDKGVQNNNLFINFKNADAISYTEGNYAEITYSIQGVGMTNMSLTSYIGNQSGYLAAVTIDKNQNVVLYHTTAANGQSSILSSGVYANSDLLNIRLTLDLFNKTINGLEINGKQLIASGTTYPWQSGVETISRMRVTAGKNGTTVRLDNIQLATYTSFDGTSPIPNKSELLEKAQYAQNCIDEASASQSKLDELKSVLDEAVSIYNNANVTEDEINSIVSRLVYSIRNCGGSVGPVAGPYSVHDSFTDGRFFKSVVTRGILLDGRINEKSYGGNAIKLQADTTQVNKSQYLDFMLGDYTVSDETGNANAFFEASIDVSSYNMAAYSKNFYIKIMDTQSNAALTEIYVVKGVNANINVTQNGVTTTIPIKSGINPAEAYNFKIVIRLTDADGNLKKQLEGVYIDGVLCDKENSEESVYPIDIIAGTKIDAIRLAVSNFKDTDTNAAMEYGVLADNVTASRYYSESGRPPLKNKADLNVILKNFDKDVLEKAASGIYDIKKKEEAQTLIEEGSRVLLDEAATEEEVDIISTQLERLQKKLSIQDGMSVDMLEPILSSNTLIGKNSVTVTAQLISAKTLKQIKNIDVAAGLYLAYENADSYSTLVKAYKQNVTIAPDDYQSCDFNFDVSEFSEEEKSKLYIKLFAFDVINKAILNEAKSKTAYLSDEFAPEETSAVRSSSPLSVYPQFDGEYSNINVVYSGETNENVMLLVTNAAAVTSGDITSEVKYMNEAITDNKGLAVFKLNSLSEGKYTVIAYSLSQGTIVSEIKLDTKSNLSNEFDALLSSPTVSAIQGASLSLGIDKSVVDAATDAGVNISKVFTEAQSADTYNIDNCQTLFKDYLEKLTILTKLRNAANADAVKLLLSREENKITGYSYYSSLSSSQKYTAENALYAGRKSADSMTAFSILLQTAAQTAVNTQPSDAPSGGGGFKQYYPSDDVSVPPPTENVAENSVTGNVTAFADLENYEWAKEAISLLIKLGAVSGKSEGVYAPADEVKREELIKMLMIAFSVAQSKINVRFADVKQDEWYTDYIASAVENGIIMGVDEQRFGVGCTVTRQDAALILYRLLSMKKAQFTENGVYIKFIDDEYIADYARGGVEMLVKSGIISGNDKNQFLPNSGLSRAEAAVLIYKAYSFLNAKGGK